MTPNEELIQLLKDHAAETAPPVVAPSTPDDPNGDKATLIQLLKDHAAETQSVEQPKPVLPISPGAEPDNASIQSQIGGSGITPSVSTSGPDIAHRISSIGSGVSNALQMTSDDVRRAIAPRPGYVASGILPIDAKEVSPGQGDMSAGWEWNYPLRDVIHTVLNAGDSVNTGKITPDVTLALLGAGRGIGSPLSTEGLIANRLGSRYGNPSVEPVPAPKPKPWDFSHTEQRAVDPAMGLREDEALNNVYHTPGTQDGATYKTIATEAALRKDPRTKPLFDRMDAANQQAIMRDLKASGIDDVLGPIFKDKDPTTTLLKPDGTIDANRFNQWYKETRDNDVFKVGAGDNYEFMRDKLDSVRDMLNAREKMLTATSADLSKEGLSGPAGGFTRFMAGQPNLQTDLLAHILAVAAGGGVSPLSGVLGVAQVAKRLARPHFARKAAAVNDAAVNSLGSKYMNYE